MENFRNPSFVERYEDIVFDLDTPIVVPNGNGIHQNKNGYRFVANNSGEAAPFDWYNARLLVDFKVQILADQANIAADDHNGIVNGSHALINKISILSNGMLLYECQPANQAVNIKNLLEYSPGYAKSTATNQFFYLDTSRSAEERTAAAQAATYNKGFAARKALLGLSATVTTEIPLNRYSFFESLENNFLPNMKTELNITLESDANLIWQAGAACRVVVTKMQLYVPRVIFNPTAESQYLSKFLKPHKWSYLREQIEQSSYLQQQTGYLQDH